MHVYQVPQVGKEPWSLTADLETSDWAALQASAEASKRPVIMGEFGAWRKNPTLFASGAAAATAMAEQQRQSCTEVKGPAKFAGWLYWTVDTWEQPRLWNMDSAPEIRAALAPRLHSDPCI